MCSLIVFVTWANVSNLEVSRKDRFAEGTRRVVHPAWWRPSGNHRTVTAIWNPQRTDIALGTQRLERFSTEPTFRLREVQKERLLMEGALGRL